MKSLRNLVVLIALALFSESKGNPLQESRDYRVNVVIYYNPYDNSSQQYIAAQGVNETGVLDLMLPNSQDLGISFVPWSNDNQLPSNCPHEDDCMPTRLHACAINMHQNLSDGNHQIFHFIVCTLANEFWYTQPTESVVQCINQIVEWPDEGESVVMCAKDKTQSDPILSALSANATAAGVSQVPWVTIAGTRSPPAETDLRATVCSSFDGTPPAGCQSSSAPGSTSSPSGSTSSPSGSTSSPSGSTSSPSGSTSSVSTASPPPSGNYRVNAEVYYNPYDSSSQHLISDQGANQKDGVWDLMLANKTDLGISFVPWTNANQGNTCPGETDCLATKLHGCAINMHQNLTEGNHQIFHFIVCTVSNQYWNSEPTRSVIQCVNQIVEWPDEGESIVECAKDKAQTDPIIAGLQDKASKAGVTKVPWVTINGKRNELAETDLLTAVCSSISDNKPSECSGRGGALDIVSSKVVVFTLAIVAILGLKL